MPRANRYFIPGHVWHITHRCHRSEFLLKFTRDRKRWRYGNKGQGIRGNKGQTRIQGSRHLPV